MSNSSTYRCSNCLAHKDKLCIHGKIRTVAMLANDYKRFMEQGGGNRDLGKLFNCVVNRPLFFGTLEECEQCDDPVSAFSPPGELHLMLGVVNQIVKPYSITVTPVTMTLNSYNDTPFAPNLTQICFNH